MKSLLADSTLVFKDDIRLKSTHSEKFNVLDYRYQKNNEKKPIILFLHGFKGFKDWGHFNAIAENFAHKNFIFIKVNVSHNGTSPEHPLDFVDLEAFGKNTLSKEQKDFRQAVDWIFSEANDIPETEINLDRFYIMGHSRGGGGVINYAVSDARVKGVSAWAPVHDYAAKWTEEGKKYWKQMGTIYVLNGRTKQNMPLGFETVEDYFAHQKALEVLPNALRSEVPILVLHGDDDATLAVEHVQQFKFTHPASRIHVIPGANHVFNGKHPWEGGALPKETLEAIEETIKIFE
ncbi:alpha/beta hydrolase family protein [Persicobacter diffluens]|uniref:Alpha/beta hydrolase n=1 Tax=Persicobacter diffluens TaxID=981 RepID=A0AAN5AJ46_9BACT|nr:hypothetical protein PEDI_10740 [Persicobacter diffluens]